MLQLQKDLLATKLYMPQLRAELVSRPRVVELLEQGRRRKLTLISASAGSGKTTALSSWLRDTQVRTAWLSLDRYDNHLHRFWTHVLAALDTLRPGLFEHAQDVLKAVRNARPRKPLPIESVVSALINALADLEDDVALVLDDYDEIITSSIHTPLAFLLAHLPENLHLFIVTQHHPAFSLELQRLRTSNQLVEIRNRDLDFSPEQAELFLITIMELDLTAEEVDILHECTDGSVAQLQFTSLALRGHPNRAGFIEAFANSYSIPASSFPAMVFQKQPRDIQQFLLYTSLLYRLNASFCRGVTGYPDSQEILAQLEQANMFIVPLDDNGTWYQYHRLFSDFLRTGLLQRYPDFVSVLHSRAAHWYLINGYYDEAMMHLL